jgi:phosphomannomutase
MREIYRGNDLNKNKEKVLEELHNLETLIDGKDAKELLITDLTHNLIINITETKDKDILDLSNNVSKAFLNKLISNMDDFSTEQLPTIFAALQLFAVEAGQYDFEITENPESEINKLTGKYKEYSDKKTLQDRAYEEGQYQLQNAKIIRGSAIQALIEFFNRKEFAELNKDRIIEWELFPLIRGINSGKRYRPFRVVEASKIADKIYRFALQARDEKLKDLLKLLYAKKQIRFGTSGFRAFINKDFTQNRSDIISLAISRELKIFQQKEGRPVIIAYDTRAYAREFALESAKVFLAQGFPVKFSEEATPTGALVYWLREKEKGEASGGENMTPSHNPLSTQGQRWNLSNGDVAPTSVTDRIEREANLINLCEEGIEKADLESAENDGKFSYFNARDPYTSWVASFLKDQELIITDNSGNTDKVVPLVEYLRDFYTNPANRFIHNAMNGAGRGYVSEIFEKIGIPIEFVYPLDSNKDEFLGLRYYANPEEQWLVPTLNKLKLIKALFECASDTDGDRCGGVLDEDKFVNLNKLMAMLMDFVTRGLGWKGHVAIRSGTTSTALDDVISKLKTEGYDIETPECEQVNSLVQHPFYDVIYLEDKKNQRVIDMQKFPSIVTEVGFKYISAAMNKYKHPAAVAGEESGGFTIKDNPDKDGIVGVCLIASMIAWHNGKPSKIWDEHMKIYGKKYDKRLDVWVSNIPKEELINSWLDRPPREIAGQKVLWVGGTRYDKVECILEGHGSGPSVISRLLVRSSGTEDIVRIYMESGSENLLQILEKYVLDRINNLVLMDIDSSQNYYELAEKVAANGLSFMDEFSRLEYFEHVRLKMEKLSYIFGMRPEEIQRDVFRQLTLLMDRDINIRHAAWGEDIGVEYYRHIFRVP